MSRIFTELTKSAQFHAPDAEKLVVLFDKSLQQINTTIQDLADIVKVQKSHDRSQEMVPLAALTDEVSLSIQEMVKEAGAQVNTDFSAVPEVYFSRVHLKSIVYNLLSNAIKYRSPERPPIINLTTTREPGFIRLTVKDNGLGINLARHQSKLFQMFKRFHSHVPGSGIGLYIVNRLVQNQGGRIEVQSTVNEGTIFTIFLKDQQ
jgi:signal transduction histidine kinase